MQTCHKEHNGNRDLISVRIKKLRYDFFPETKNITDPAELREALEKINEARKSGEMGESLAKFLSGR